MNFVRDVVVDTFTLDLFRGGGDVGRKVTCCIRPERVRLSGGGGGGGEENCLRATYQGHTYMGATCRHQCELADGSPFAALTVGKAESLAPGEAVRVFFLPDDVVILE